MPRLQSLVPLLRPLAASRAVACRQHLRFSTATTWQAEQAPPSSRPIAQPSLPPNASSQHPSTPQEAQRAAHLAAAESLTEVDSAQPPEQKPTLPSKYPRADNKPTNTLSPAKPAQAHDVAPTPSDVVNTASTLKKKVAKKPKTPRAPGLSLPPPKYVVSRSANKNLPIYTDYKRGGNLHLTTVRKITGDVSALRNELTVFLNKKTEDVKINSVTQHVVVKGHHPSEIADFLRARGM